MEVKAKDHTKAKGVAVLEKADGATRQAPMATNSNSTTAVARITLNEIVPAAKWLPGQLVTLLPLRINLASAWAI